MRSRLVWEGVIETVVPGQTRISPPRPSCKTAVSHLVVTEDPAASRVPAKTIAPAPPVTGTMVGAALAENPATVGACCESLFAFTSSAGLRRTMRRLPAPSHVYA